MTVDGAKLALQQSIARKQKVLGTFVNCCYKHRYQIRLFLVILWHYKHKMCLAAIFFCIIRQINYLKKLSLEDI